METKEKTKTLEPVKIEKLVFSPMVRHKVVTNIDVLRIELEENYTRIDFICYARISQFRSFAWISICHDTFIRPVGIEQKLSLIKAVNIPCEPQKHFFKNEKDFLCYTLYFPPLPKDVKTIDIIEKEINGGNWFNFYGVSVQKIKQEVLIVFN